MLSDSTPCFRFPLVRLLLTAYNRPFQFPLQAAVIRSVTIVRSFVCVNRFCRAG